MTPSPYLPPPSPHGLPVSHARPPAVWAGVLGRKLQDGTELVTGADASDPHIKFAYAWVQADEGSPEGDFPDIEGGFGLRGWTDHFPA